jgi:hypothetical protein
MSMQEIFDTVVNHLRSQGCKSEGEFNGKKCCFYRGPNGTRCAAGVLIPDDEYSPKMEHRLVDDLPFFSKYSERERSLIFFLQGVHDLNTPEFWEKRLKEVADQFDLEYLPLES